jgi:hypothetical protein
MPRFYLLVSLLALPSLACAQEVAAAEPSPFAIPADPAPRYFRPWSITVSPLWLPFMMANGTLEYQPSRRWGAALKGHYGILNMGTADKDPSTWDLFTGEYEVLMAGGKLRVYPFLDALHFAAGTSWFQLRHEGTNEPVQKGSGWTANGLVGLKGVARSGFTLDVQIGAMMNLPDVGLRWGEDWGPLARLNLGWSFRPPAFAR